MKDDLLSARVKDLYDLTFKTSVPHYLGFLSESEAAVCEEMLKCTSAKFLSFGGFDAAERKMLCCMPDWCDEPDFPIKAITFEFNSSYKLSHRDFLGSLMALGITRESVGDILVESGRAVAFVKTSVLKFILTQIEKIGRVGVQIKLGFQEPLPSIGELISCTTTVSSMRLDCVISAICGVSRNAALEYIEAGKVYVNSLPTQRATKLVLNGDSVTVRSKGKFYIVESDEHSKKGRIILKYNKYK